MKYILILLLLLICTPVSAGNFEDAMLGWVQRSMPSFYTSGTDILPRDATWNIGATSTPIAGIITNYLYVLSGLKLGGVITTLLDLDGKELILDADGDSSLQADTDDQLDLKLGGADRLSITTNTATFSNNVSILETLTVSNQSTFASTSMATTTISRNLIVDTNTLYVDVDNNRVGVGTTTPEVALDVVGQIRTDTSFVDSGLTIGSVPYITTGGEITQNNSQLFWDATNLRFGFGPMSADLNFADGKLVVAGVKGRAYGGAPSKNLWINDLAACTVDDRGGAITFGAYYNANQITSIAAIESKVRAGAPTTYAGDLDFLTRSGTGSAATAPRMTIKYNGKVGINTTTPDYKLDVNGNASITESLEVGGNASIAFDLDVNGSGNISENLDVGGNFTAKIPYGMFSSNESQVVTVAETVYVLNFTHIEDDYLMELEGSENITIKQSGDYLIALSGLFVTDANNKHFEIFPQTTHTDGVTFVNVPRSNTLIEVENAGTYGLIAVTFILDLNAGDKFRIMYSSDDAGSMTVSVAGHGVGVNAVPATPSMIMTVNKVSEITD